MSSGLVIRLVYLLVYVGVLFGASAFIDRGRTPDKRRREGDDWARQRLAYVEPRWSADVDRCLERNRRVDLWGMGLLGVALWSVPPSLGAYVACLAAAPAVLAIARGYTATRADYLPPGPRVARLRELSIRDYLPRSIHLTMWGTVMVAATWALVTGFRTGWWVAFAAVVVVAAGAAVEVTGSRFARAPEPAGDAAHLYWQDAMRADVLRSAAGFVGASAALMCVALIGFGDDRRIVLALSVMALMLGPALVFESRAQAAPAAHMRSRLWPTLEVGQVLGPGDALPTGAARS